MPLPVSVPPEVTIVVIGTVFWYLFSQAELTRFIWSRYPAWLDSWASCPACSGTWFTSLAALVLDFPVLGYAAHTAPALVLAGLWGCFFVPLASWLLVMSLTRR